MLVAAAVAPHPPALLPWVGRGDRLAEVRTSALHTVSALVRARPEVVVVVGAADPPRRGAPTAGERACEPSRWDESAAGTTDRYGVAGRVGPADGPDVLPLSLTVGAYLLSRARWAGPRRYVAVPPALDPVAAGRLGRGLAMAEASIALLTMGDGSASRTEDSPGAYDPEGAAFDAEVMAALTGPSPDVVALAALDPGRADAVWAAGRASWQVLAGAVAGSEGTWAVSEPLRELVPAGVGYFTVAYTRT